MAHRLFFALFSTNNQEMHLPAPKILPMDLPSGTDCPKNFWSQWQNVLGRCDKTYWHFCGWLQPVCTHSNIYLQLQTLRWVLLKKSLQLGTQRCHLSHVLCWPAALHLQGCTHLQAPTEGSVKCVPKSSLHQRFLSCVHNNTDLCGWRTRGDGKKQKLQEQRLMLSKSAQALSLILAELGFLHSFCFNVNTRGSVEMCCQEFYWRN